MNCRGAEGGDPKGQGPGPEGLVGVNIMVAMETLRRLCAGRHRRRSGRHHLRCRAAHRAACARPGADILLAPIVSSARAVKVICRAWERKAGRYPDFVVVEGPLAGGHLGFSAEEAEGGTAASLETIVPEVIAELRPYEEKAGRPIPVFPAGAS